MGVRQRARGVMKLRKKARTRTGDGGLVDKRTVGQPFKLQGSGKNAEDEYINWARQLTNYIEATHRGKGRKAIKWAESQATNKITQHISAHLFCAPPSMEAC